MTVELNIATLMESVGMRVPDRLAVIGNRDRRSFAEFLKRSRRLGRFLANQGLGCFAERDKLYGHESGQHIMAQYLYNGPEYLEGMVGAFRARVAPCNVNYRYVVDELAHLLEDAQPSAIQFHSRLAPTLAEVLPRLATRPILLQVDDGTGYELLSGAVDYEDALASVAPEVDAVPSPDDLYLVYTGGTTGMPKAVLWRQADAAVSALGLVNRWDGREWDSVEECLSMVRPEPRHFMPCAPLIHGAGQWGALQALCQGNTVVFPSKVTQFDPADVWDTVQRERVTDMSIVGDAFARGLANELEVNPRDISSLRYLISGGAALQPIYKRRLISSVPGMSIVEHIGASETGFQGRLDTADEGSADERMFSRGRDTVIISEDCTSILAPGHDGVGWIASRGRVPLGYYRDEEKTRSTFPVVEGIRLSVPGDRARLLEGEVIELLGRDSVTINTGGEKVFAEEVEAVVKAHVDVADAVVCGRPSERWGSEVVAVVSARDGVEVDSGSLIDECSRYLARYKLPKDVVVVDEVRRLASGKADYRWALLQVTRGLNT